MRDTLVFAVAVGGVILFANKANASSGNAIARRLVKNTESLSLTPYMDQGGTWHVGYGHKLPGKPSYDHISQYQATQFLNGDIREAANAVDRYVKVPLTPYQRAALISFTFNLGADALKRSTLLKDVNARKMQAAATEFHRWVYVNGQRSSGLATRREAEKQVFNYVT